MDQPGKDLKETAPSADEERMTWSPLAINGLTLTAIALGLLLAVDAMVLIAAFRIHAGTDGFRDDGFLMLHLNAFAFSVIAFASFCTMVVVAWLFALVFDATSDRLKVTRRLVIVNCGLFAAQWIIHLAVTGRVL